MICSETSEYLFAFLDNELDASLSMDFQHHIDHCAVCAREIEIERAIHGQLACALKTLGSEIPFNKHAIKQILRQSKASIFHYRLTSRRTFLAACAAVIVTVGITSYFTIQYLNVINEHSRFINLVVSDFKQFLREGQPIHFASSNANAVSDWLMRQTDIEVILPSVKGTYCKLIGARKCEIQGEPAAFVVYEMKGTPISLLAVTGRSDALKQLDQIEHNGRIHWVDSLKDISVVAYRQNNLVYTMVSKLNKHELIHFLSGASNENN
ncbi:MAG: twin-arginine translocation signal domain-containing protein [Planctomycetes bacterium]|nr:twin-arginine translocation signal domain-containing protein [Planctomycetota bacterium]